MKLLFAALISVCILAFIPRKTEQTTRVLSNSELQKMKQSKLTVSCAPDRNLILAALEDIVIPPLSGWGDYNWKISTSSDSAQFYFNQGMAMYYGFHIIESLASFKKASLFDPNNAMIYWGEALALGPNINDLEYAASPEALEATSKAVQFSSNCTKKEQLLISAMSVRYTKDSTQTRRKLNELYSAAMKKAYLQIKNDADIATLYADALMLEHPWDLWQNNGQPKSWTPAIRDVLEKTLSIAPQHPGTNHYYIHVMEASPYVDLAIPSADRLGSISPGISHLVHMPSHIYLRTGHYTKGSSVNESAVKSYHNYLQNFPQVAGADFLYSIHNLHMQTTCAMMNGRSEYAQRSAELTRKSIDSSYLSMPAPLGNYIQYIYSTPLLVNIRFGNWDMITEKERPDARHVYASLLYHFASGMKYANKKDFAAAKDELNEIKRLSSTDNSLNVPIKPFSPPSETIKVALNILEGTIALKEQNLPQAIKYYKAAVAVESDIVYNEPRDWLLSSKQYLGAAYLEAGQFDDAIRIFQSDLRDNNDNGWSLCGWWIALKKQNKNSEAAAIEIRYRKAFTGSDVFPSWPVYY